MTPGHKLNVAVEKVLTPEPVAFDEVWMKLPKTVDKGDLRESLLWLQKHKKADLQYGFGWFKPAKGKKK